MPKKTLGLLTATLLLALPTAAAHATPVTVDLRIEGATRTLFEGPVTTDVRAFKFSDSPQTYECNGSAGEGASTTRPTRGAVLATASEQAPFEMLGSFGQFGASFTRIAGDNVDYDAGSGRFLAEYKNGVSSSYGACGETVGNGDRVLFAYATGSENVLALRRVVTEQATAPGADLSVRPGATDRVRVTDAATNAPVAGAVVDGKTSGADGTVDVGPFAERGDHDLKATKTGAIRSNRVRVCVSDGGDGFCGNPNPDFPPPVTAYDPPPAPCATSGDDGRCGSPDKRPAAGRITSVREGQSFAKGKGPRTLGGTVADDPSGIKEVRVRLTRNDRGNCSGYDVKRERFVARKDCSASAGRYVAIATTQTWSYLLPARLGRGRYVLDVQVVDRAGNVDTALARGSSRIVFRVG